MRLKLALLLIPILAYGGSIGYLRYEVGATADDAIRSAAPIAEIEYRSVYTSALGDEVGLDGIVIRPTMGEDEFRIDRMRIKVPHIGYFLSSGKRMNSGKPPKNLGVEISGLELDINSSIFDMVDQALQQHAGTSLDALGCGDIEAFSLRDYRRMGIGTTITDIALSSTYDEELNNLRISFSASSQGLGEIEGSSDFEVEPETTAMALAGSTIRSLAFGYRDTGYYKLRNDYCARLNESSTEAYVDRNLELIGEEYGVTIPAQALAAYKTLMSKGGELHVRLNPGNGIRFGDLQYMRAAEIARMLDPKILINGTPLDVTQLGWEESQGEDIPTHKPTGERQPRRRVAPPAVVEAPERVDIRTLTFRTIPLSDARKYQGKLMQITTTDGRIRKGRLQRIEDERLYLTMELRGGAITYPVKSESITEVKVQN